MEPMVLSSVVVQRSRDELTLMGRLRVGLLAASAVVFGVIMLTVPMPAAVYFRILMAAGVAIGVSMVVARARSRLVLRPTGFVVSGYEGLWRYQLTGPLAALDIVGVVPMMPQFENMPYKDPDYFLEIAVDGKIVREFRGLPRAELDEIAIQIRDWKANVAG